MSRSSVSAVSAILVTVFAVSAQAQTTVFSSVPDDFASVVLDPHLPGEDPFIAGMHEFNQIWCRGDLGQITLETTGGNPGSYLRYNFWSAITIMWAMDPAVLGDTGVVNFDWINGDGTQELNVVGMMDGQICKWFDFYNAAGVITPNTIDAVAAADTWESRSIAYDLTGTSCDAIAFVFDMTGPSGTGIGVDNIEVLAGTGGILGDTDDDGDVDLDDLFAVRNNFGTTSGATKAGGDTDEDGDVDLDDLFNVRNTFGSSLIVVPEPMTLSVMVLGGLALIRRKR